MFEHNKVIAVTIKRFTVLCDIVRNNVVQLS